MQLSTEHGLHAVEVFFPAGTGPFYPYYYGYSFFVPELGPVAGVERRVITPDTNMQEDVAQMVEYVLDLVGVIYTE